MPLYILTLLPKGDPPVTWHPASLLCKDYKVIVKVILLHLKSVQADVIHPNWMYVVPGQCIYNLYLVLDLLKVACRDGLSLTLLSFNQEKALDRVGRGYLTGTPRAFHFGSC